jgi:PEGA domain
MKARLVGRTALACAALVLSPALAHAAPPAAPAGESDADDNVAKAVSRFKRGQELYTERNFSGALIEFRKAYELAPNYRVLYNVGQVCFQMQDYVCALRSLEQYLADGASEINEARRQSVQAELGSLKARIGYLDIRTNVEGAEISVDDVVVGTTPLKAPVAVSAGRHKTVASLAGRAPVTRTTDVAGQDTARLDLELSSLRATNEPRVTAPAPVPVEATPPSTMTTLSWVGYGVGAALLAGGGVTGALALGSAGDVKTKVYPDVASADADRSSTTTLAATADVLLAAGVVTVVATTIFTFVVPRGPGAKKNASLFVTPAGFSTRYTF